MSEPFKYKSLTGDALNQTLVNFMAAMRNTDPSKITIPAMLKDDASKQRFLKMFVENAFDKDQAFTKTTLGVGDDREPSPRQRMIALARKVATGTGDTVSGWSANDYILFSTMLGVNGFANPDFNQTISPEERAAAKRIVAGYDANNTTLKNGAGERDFRIDAEAKAAAAAKLEAAAADVKLSEKFNLRTLGFDDKDRATNIKNFTQTYQESLQRDAHKFSGTGEGMYIDEIQAKMKSDPAFAAKVINHVVSGNDYRSKVIADLTSGDADRIKAAKSILIANGYDKVSLTTAFNDPATIKAAQEYAATGRGLGDSNFLVTSTAAKLEMDLPSIMQNLKNGGIPVVLDKLPKDVRDMVTMLEGDKLDGKNVVSGADLSEESRMLIGNALLDSKVYSQYSKDLIAMGGLDPSVTAKLLSHTVVADIESKSTELKAIAAKHDGLMRGTGWTRSDALKGDYDNINSRVPHGFKVPDGVTGQLKTDLETISANRTAIVNAENMLTRYMGDPESFNGVKGTDELKLPDGSVIGKGSLTFPDGRKIDLTTSGDKPNPLVMKHLRNNIALATNNHRGYILEQMTPDRRAAVNKHFAPLGRVARLTSGSRAVPAYLRTFEDKNVQRFFNKLDSPTLRESLTPDLIRSDPALKQLHRLMKRRDIIQSAAAEAPTVQGAGARNHLIGKMRHNMNLFQKDFKKLMEHPEHGPRVKQFLEEQGIRLSSIDPSSLGRQFASANFDSLPRGDGLKIPGAAIQQHFTA